MSSSETARPGRVRTDPAQPGQEPDVVVFGQVARDLVLVVDAVPGPGRSASVRQRREMLGGKGADQAVGLAQLGMRPMLAGVIGEDQVGRHRRSSRRQAGADAEGHPGSTGPGYGFTGGFCWQ